MDTATRVQILDETVYISDSANALGKGINPIILPSALRSGECEVHLYSHHFQVPFEVVKLVRFPSMGQIDLFKNYSYSIWLCAKNFVTTQKMEIWTYNERDSLTFWHKISQDRLLCRSNQSIYELRLISAKSEIRDARKYEGVKNKSKSTFKLRRVVDKFVARKMSIYIYVYIYMRVCLCTCVCIWVGFLR